jgi:HlyD family secretion protein
MKMKSGSVILAVLLVLLTGMLGACGPKNDSPEADTTETVTVGRGSLVTSVTAVGSVRPEAEVVLSFEISGRVTDVLVRSGDQVQKDQPLARLDSADLSLQVRNAEASLASVQAQLDQIVAGPTAEDIRAAEGQLASAEAALAQAIAQRDQLITGTKDSEIVVAQTQVDAARSRVTQLERQLAQTKAQDPAPDVTVAEIEVERAKITLDETQDEYNKALDRPWEEQEIRDSWAKQLEQAQLNYRQAQAQLQRALNTQNAYYVSLRVLEAQIEEAKTSLTASEAQLLQATDSDAPRKRASGASVDSARAQRDIAQAQLDALLAGASASEIAIAQANVDQAQVALDRARLGLERATLRAPLAGTIGAVDADPGTYVGPQIPAMTLVNDKQFSVEADVDEVDVGWLAVGQEVQITLDAFMGRGLTGEVVAILPSGTLDLGVVSYRVTIALDPGDLPLRSGMTANTEIIREQRQDVLVVPNRAIWIDANTGRPFVEKSVDGEAVVAYIEQGVSNDEFSEIVSGLEEGERLIVRSASIRDRFREVVTSSMTGQ